MAMLAVLASRTRVTVWLSGLRLASATGPGLVGLRPRSHGERPAVLGAVMQAFEQGVAAVDLVAGGAEALADRSVLGASGDAVLQEPGWSGWVPERVWMRSWV